MLERYNMKDLGFTVLELLITIVIIGILVIIAVPSLRNARKTAQIGAAVDILRNVCASEEVYFAKTGYYYYTTLQGLAQLKLLDDRFKEQNILIDNYKFSSKAKGTKFKITATPIDSSYPEFYVDESFVIKFANGTPIGSK